MAPHNDGTILLVCVSGSRSRSIVESHSRMDAPKIPENEAPGNRLMPPVDDARDHSLGDPGAEITLLEYGSYVCPSCHAAHEIIANLRDRFGDRMRYVFRQRPIADDPDAVPSAVLAEYAHESAGRYWEAHDALMKRGPVFAPDAFAALAAELELPPHDDAHDDAWHHAEKRVRDDRESARRSGAMISPTFFINDRRYDGPWDESSLAEAMLGSPGHRVKAAALDFADWAPSTGVILLIMSVLAVVLANSAAGPAFEAWWTMPVGLSMGSGSFGLSLREWINDGLLSIFFLVVGLEIKREFTVGHLASSRAAALPIAASVGGMLAPALIYVALAPAGLAHGWAIPTSTDTAFAIALIAVLGRRVPRELRIFLTAVVIVDDLVAIAIVALFYSGAIDVHYLATAALTAGLLVLLNRSGVYRPLPYALLGIVLWTFLHKAGVHATLAGVILAIVTPTRPPPNFGALVAQAETVLRDEMRRANEKLLRHGPSTPALRALDAIHDRIESPADKLLRSIEPWSSYLVLPLFAFANAGVLWSLSVVESREGLILAIALGLVLGKPVGIVLAAALAVWAGIAVKPAVYSWRQMLGAGALAGIGFTMSLYIAGKALPDADDFAAAKIAVFLASIIAAGLGTALLWSCISPGGDAGAKARIKAAE
jgi:Na+:H+ antiporter, NhaA family